jgi:sigma-E factor negative regulatory protein RseC
MAGLIEHQGVIRHIDGERMTVSVNISGCDGCGHGSSCGMNKLARQQGDTTVMEFVAHPNLQVGDVVTLALPESRMGGYAVLGYLFPALAFLGGSAVGTAYSQSDIGTAIGGISALFISLVLTRFSGRLFPSLIPTPEITPYITHELILCNEDSTKIISTGATP